MTTLASVDARAMGTTARVVVAGAALDQALALMTDELEPIEQACSRFRSDSDISRVNAGGGDAVVVDQLLVDAVDVALRAARITDGRVDPTIGRALRLLGYDRDFAAIASGTPQARLRVGPVPGWKCVVVDHARSTIRVPAGVALDLGATAKAFAADRAARRVASALGVGTLVSLGGDVAIAGEAPAGGWPIRVTDDHSSALDAPGQTVSLASGGLATSSVTVRQWVQGEECRHHIVDPATGLPAPGPFRTVSVAAASCVDANIASTAALVMGGEAPEWLADRCLPARLTRHDGTALVVGDWPTP